MIEMNEDITISKKIKMIRERYNISQERFGLKIGVSGKTVSAYETGRCIPPLKVLERITSAYDESFLQLRKDKREALKDRINGIKESLKEIEEMLNKSVSF